MGFLRNPPHGRIDGYGGLLDLDIAYMDAPAWGEFANPSGTATGPDLSSDPQGSTADLAAAVIRGEYGDGEERRNALGRNYDAVQRRVNDLMA